MARDIVDEVLSFWFEEGIVPGICEYRPIWFASPPEFDAAISDRFSADFERASRDELDHITESPKGALALIVMLDQFPRSLFRNGPRAFATDAKARDICSKVIARGNDRMDNRAGVDVAERMRTYNVVRAPVDRFVRRRMHHGCAPKSAPSRSLRVGA